MKCNKCGEEMRIGAEQVGVNCNQDPVVHRFAYCDKCKLKTDLEVANKKSMQGKISVLSIIALCIAIVGGGYLSTIGLLLGVIDVLKKDERKKICSIIAIIITFVWYGILFLMNPPESSVTPNTVTPTTQQTTEALLSTEESKVETSTTENVDKTNVFTEEFSKETSIEISEKLYDILINQIGFEEVFYESKIDNTNNYYIMADNVQIVVTVIDDDFRIFKPNSDIVIYESSTVLLTKEDIENKTVDSDEAIVWYAIAQGIIEENLKNPKSADFPSHNEAEYKVNGNVIAVRSYVYAKNSFGAEVKSNWVVQFTLNEDETYNVNYIEIDGEKSGSFINE